MSVGGCPGSIPEAVISLLSEQSLQGFRSLLRYRYAFVCDSIHPDRLSSVYNAYQELLGSDAEELLASAREDMSGYPWSDSPEGNNCQLKFVGNGQHWLHTDAIYIVGNLHR